MSASVDAEKLFELARYVYERREPVTSLLKAVQSYLALREGAKMWFFITEKDIVAISLRYALSVKGYALDVYTRHGFEITVYIGESDVNAAIHSMCTCESE